MKTQLKTDPAVSFLTELNRTIKAIRIYPGNHPARMEIVKKLSETTEATLVETGAVTLSINDGKIICNGKTLTDNDATWSDMASYFYTRQISTISFMRPLCSSELVDVLSLLNDSPPGTVAWQDRLDESGISSVKINRVDLDDLDFNDFDFDTEGGLDSGSDLETLAEIIGQSVLSVSEKNTVIAYLNRDAKGISDVIHAMVLRRSETQIPQETAFLTARMITAAYQSVMKLSHKKQRQYLARLAGSLSFIDHEALKILVKDYIFPRIGIDHAIGAIARELSDGSLAELIIAGIAGQDTIPEGFEILMSYESYRDGLAGELDRIVRTEYFSDVDRAIMDRMNQVAHAKCEDAQTPVTGGLSSLLLQTLMAGWSDSVPVVLEPSGESLDKRYILTLANGLILVADDVSLRRISQKTEGLLWELVSNRDVKGLSECLNIIDTGVIDRCPEPFVFEKVMAIKRDLATDDTVKMLIDEFGQDVDSRDSVNNCISSLSKPAIERLIGRLALEDDMNRRRWAVQILGSVGLNHIDVIAGHKDDEKWYVVRNLVLSLGLIGGEKAIDLLLVMKDHAHSKVRAEVIQSLGRLNDVRTTRALTNFLKDHDPDLRIKAIKQLEVRKSESALGPLIEIIESKDKSRGSCEVKIEAIEAVGRMGYSKAVPTLKNIANEITVIPSSKKMEAKSAAKRALRRITLNNKRMAIGGDMNA